MNLLELFVKVNVDNRGVDTALRKTEARAQKTEDAGGDIGKGFAKGAATSKKALQGVGNAIEKTRNEARKGATFTVEGELDDTALKSDLANLKRSLAGADTTIDVDVAADTAGATASMNQWRASQDGQSIDQDVDIDTAGATAEMAAWRAKQGTDAINQDVDVDTGAATAKLVAFRALAGSIGGAVGSMGQGMSAGAVGFTSIAAAATLAAAALGPLMGGLAAIGGLAAGAGAGIGLIAAPIALVVSGLTKYHEGLEKAKAAQGTASSSAAAYQTVVEGVVEVERGVVTAEGQVEVARETLQQATDALEVAQRDLNYAMEDEPTNQAQASLDLADARDQVGDATRDYNEAVKEHGANSEEATDAARALKQAELDLSQQTRDTSRTRRDGSSQLQSAMAQEESASQGVQDAQRGLDQAYAGVAAAQRNVAKAQMAAAQAAQKVAEDQNALKEATVGISPAMLGLYNALMRFKTAATTALQPAMDIFSRLGTRVLGVATGALPFLGRAATSTMGAFSTGVRQVLDLFSQATQRQSLATIFGAATPIIANLVPAFGKLAAALVNIMAVAAPAGIALSQVILNISDGIVKWSQSEAGVGWIKAAIQSAIPVFSALWDMVVRVGGALLQMGMGKGQGVATAIRWITDALVIGIHIFSAFLNLLGPTGIAIVALIPVVAGLALVFGTIVGILTPLMPIFGAVAGVMSGPVVLAIVALGAAVALLVMNWDRIRPALQPVINLFKQLGTAAKNLWTVITGNPKEAQKAWGMLPGWVQKAYVAFLNFRNKVRAALTGAAQVIKTALQPALKLAQQVAQIFVRWWQANLPLMQRTAQAVFNRIRAVVSGVMNAIKAVVSAVWGAIKANWQRDNGFLRTVVSAAWKIISTVVKTAVKVLLGVIKLGMQLITGNWKGAWNTLKKIIQTVVKGWGTVLKQGVRIAGAILKAGWGLIKRVTQTAWNGIKAVVSAVWNAIKKAVTQVVAALRKSVQNGWNTIRKVTQSVWNGIRNLLQSVWRAISNAVKSALNGIRNAIQQAWNTIKSLTQSTWNAIKSLVQSVWNAIKSLITSALNAVKTAITNAWNAIKSATTSAWNAIKSAITNAWNSIKSAVQSAVDTVKQKINDAWDTIKQATTSAWQAIKKAIVDPISNAVGEVGGFLQDIVDKVNGVLKLVNLGPLGGGGDDSSNVKGTTAPGYAEGGRVREQPGGVYRVAEAGQDEWVINPQSRRYVSHLRGAAREGGYDVVPRDHRAGNKRFGGPTHPYVPPRVRARLTPRNQLRNQLRSGEGLYPTMHTYIPEMDSYRKEMESQFSGQVYTNTYAGHPIGFEQPYYRERSIDFWGPGARGNSIDKGVGDAVTNAAISKLGGNLNWLIWYGKMLDASGWGPDISGFDHHGHVHNTAFADGGTVSGGEGTGSFNPLVTVFNEAWERVIQPIVDTVLGPLKDSQNVMANFAGAAAQKVPDGIKAWALEKLGDSGGSLPGGSSPAGLTIGEALSQGGWPSDLLIAGSSTIWHESTGNASVMNPSGATGLMQIMPATAEGVGADPSRLKDPIYNTSTGKKVYDQAGGWGPWVGAGQGGDYRNEPVTGYTGGALVRRTHRAEVHPNDLYLPLDRPNVATAARQALGTKELSAEIEALRWTLTEHGINVHDLGAPASEKIMVSGEGGALRIMRSDTGRRELERAGRENGTRNRMAGRSR